MRTTGLFSNVLSALGIFMIGVGLSLFMVQPALAANECTGGCKFGILLPDEPPTSDDCLTVDCDGEDCSCVFNYNDETAYYSCDCK